MKICLVCSSGGHFFELYCLKEFWSQHQHFWVTFLKQDTRHLLQGEKVYWAYQPTNRNIKNFFRNLYLAWRIFRIEKPDVVISTGAGVGVPFIYLARLFKKKTIYIELMTRIKEISLSGKLVYPIIHHFFVQWPELANRYKKAKFKGGLYDICYGRNRKISF